MTLETLSSNTAFGGVQGIYRHRSTATGTDMTFAVYVPPHAKGAKLAVVWYDHSYYFISTFIAEHLTWHAARLKV